MRFGCCFGSNPVLAAALRDAGFDYGEVHITHVMQKDDAEFAAYLHELQTIGLPIEGGCVMLPGGMAINRLQRDFAAMDAYLQKAAQRCRTLGMQTVVFGSGGARRAPEGLGDAEMFEDLVVFLRDHAAPAFSQQGIRIAIEPLSERPCAINTVCEAIKLADAVGRDDVQVLADAFHMYKENDDISNIRKAGGRLLHAHICSPEARRIPVFGDGYDLYPFLKAVADTGCERVSVEGHVDAQTFPQEVREAIVRLREARDKIAAECGETV